MQTHSADTEDGTGYATARNTATGLKHGPGGNSDVPERVPDRWHHAPQPGHCLNGSVVFHDPHCAQAGGAVRRKRFPLGCRRG